ncbi:TIGR01212 family radical SAM protein [uncultured Ruminococcus sp.]|uniref:TIGR01212 family radical SAM protein n=1 Tax=uncultured Ruminococcus sp. TaxID=165186 RepID=UPI0034C6553D
MLFTENGAVMYYYSLNEYLKNTFGEKVYKISLDGGMTCPNRDGKIDTRGCIFCSRGGSGEFSADRNHSITEQIREAKERIGRKTDCKKFIAYFQPFTNTYAPVEYLEKIFTEAVAPDEIVALSVATRPDCLPDKTVNLLSRLNKIKPVWVELGLQTVHKSTADYIRRGYDLSVYDDAVKRLHKEGISVITHIIIGLPNETEDMIVQSAEYAGKCSDGIKLQLLHILKDTDLCDEYEKGNVPVLSLERYADILVKCLRVIPKTTVIHRLTGDGDKKILAAPLWSADKKRVLNYINKVLRESE